ncbi:hypothetical protein PhCBS80983_g05578 [Powellomyces hirtus]|uniref:Uncharacterized protein n=1 Tax=Powellomyces hirtus TaxID=109895 RepID=A0A507DTN5_9FUNG|nr:hypothetical protein PhCBS80983_g05578 [Powellomyces hirtus]
MWKSTTGHQVTHPVGQQKDDEDWDTDPDFVNDVDEKNQRWGNQKTVDVDGSAKTDLDMDELRKNVVEKNDQRAKMEWENRNGQSVKESYGVGKATGKV